ncbi:DUF1217 domain-containing protein [Hyphococcus flavus]|uniref:DUF1217 domain-containing protein n=1 Tax=Hyphococcus flavus TaxID=1866326 RepID=A0AAE9ZBG7_9PROT|nr:DUF1217 domain-containing protein [Hyphococcus flavus]WDI31553.1 DUF1217 domain-containing protein [Hyphococcus flavus]
MTFYPAIPLGGYLGWKVFDNSADRQFEVFKNSPTIVRNVEYFRENIAEAKTAEDLVNDRRLLEVALGAYGLQEEINKKAWIQKILEEGTDLSDAFANRLSDSRWREFAKGFGYGNFTGPQVGIESFREQTANNYLERAFEVQVGDVNTDMRLAMNFRREIAKIANGANVETAGWFQIMGQEPLRAVMEGALGLPSSVGQADIDKQKDLFARKAEQFFGGKSPAVFKDPVKVEDALRRFFLQTEIQNGPTASTPGVAALSILGGGPSLGASSIANLFISNTF